MRKALLKVALRMALKRFKDHPEFRNFIHYSFIVHDNKIIGCGENNTQIPPVHYGYERRILDTAFRPKTHSEICAYRRVRGLLCGADFEMINIRLNRTGKLRNSKPCWCCSELLAVLGCKKIYYSTNDGFVLKII